MARQLGILILCTAGYVLLAKLGLSLATLHGNVSPVWPPTGYAISLLLIGGRHLWPAIFLGAFIANAQTPISMGAALGIAVGNTFEALLGYLLISSATSHWKFVREVHLAAKIVLGASVGALASASIGTASLLIFGDASLLVTVDLFVTWLIGDLLGALILVPLALSVQDSWRNQRTFEAYHRSLCCLCLVVATSGLVFFTTIGQNAPLLVFPALLLAGLYAGHSTLMVSMLVVSGIAVSATTFGSGPFVASTTNENLLHLQLFLGAMAVTSLGISFFRSISVPRTVVAVLLLGWVATNGLYAIYAGVIRSENEEHFHRLIRDVERRIDHRLRVYQDALLSGASLFAASQSVEPGEWEQFVDSLRLQERYPGIHGMGVIFPVDHASRQSFLDWARTEVGAGFEILTMPDAAPSSHEESFVITYIEPLEHNHQAQGFDIGSDPTRRIAAEYARRTGLPAMTGRISLVQDQKREPAFLFLVPLYKKATVSTSDEERLRNFQAWIYAPFVTSSFFSGVRDEWTSEIALKVFQGNEPVNENLIYSSLDTGTNTPSRVTELNLAGNSLALAWTPLPGFRGRSESMAVWLSVLGALGTLMLSALIGSLSTLERRASQLVIQRTTELEHSRKQAEEAAQTARVASAAKGMFLANMSHELRTPLNGIVGMSDLLLETTLTAEQQDYVATVKGCSANLISLINDILDLSKIEAGKLNMANEPFLLQQVIKNVVNMLSSKALEKKLEVGVQVDPLLEESFFGDRIRIGQVLANLLGNAIKFTPVGGSIKVHAQSAGERDGRRLIQISVSDTGIGIPSDKIGLIFERFAQADTSTTRTYGGSGLGLTISRQLVEIMGGSIWVDSVVGSGSTFHTVIPLRVVRSATEATTPTSSPHRSKSPQLHILLAEDNPVNQRLAARILEKNGHTVTVAQNGKEALELFQHHLERAPFDLVLMDCQMPVLSGYDATRLMRAQEASAGGHIPIIAMTANAMDGDREGCLDAGMDDYISKPFQKDKLLDLVHRWAT